MRHLLTVIILCLVLLFNMGLVNAERIDESEGKEINLSIEQWKRLNTFFSNFSEVGLRPFSENGISNSQLIDFGVGHNYKNNPNLFETAENSGNFLQEKIREKYVEASIKKYFGKKILKHESTSKECVYKDGYYIIYSGSGEAYYFAQVTKLIDIGDNYYIAYTNEYVASSGFTGDPNGTLAKWKMENEKDEGLPEIWNKMRAIIKLVTEHKTSRYILIEYQQIKK